MILWQTLRPKAILPNFSDHNSTVSFLHCCFDHKTAISVCNYLKFRFEDFQHLISTEIGRENVRK